MRKAFSSRFGAANGKSDEAWWLATSSDKSQRDGAKAVKLASEICAASDYKCHRFLNTLAAAYAETGDFDRAVEYQQKAIKLAPDDSRDSYARYLKAYQKHKPWRT